MINSNEAKTDLLIDKIIDKQPLVYKLSDDKIINITGEGGSGKTTLSSRFQNDPNYIVIDYDLVIDGTCQTGSIEHFIREKITGTYGQDFFNVKEENDIQKVFTTMYTEILNMLSSEEKILVLDGTQLRFITDVNLIKGEVIILRPSIETCIQRSVIRKKQKNPKINDEELKAYEDKRRHILYKLNPMLNNLILQIDNKIQKSKENESQGLKH